MAASSSEKEKLLAEAEENEKRYEWEKAARSYKSFLESAPESSTALELSFRLAKCHELAAYQTDSSDDYRSKIEKTLAVYREIERRLAGDSESVHRRIAEAVRLRLESMLAEDIPQHQRLLDEAINIHRTVVAELEGEDIVLWLKTGNFHLLLLLERFWLEEGEQRLIFLNEGLSLAEKLTTAPSLQRDLDAFAYAHYFRLRFANMAYLNLREWYAEAARQTRILDEALPLVSKIHDKRVLAALYYEAANVIFNVKGLEAYGEKSSLGLQEARITGDKCLIGQGLSAAAFLARWKLIAERDEEQARKRFEEVVTFFEEGKKTLHHLLDLSSQIFLAGIHAEVVQSHYVYATNFVTDRTTRKGLIEKGVEFFRQGAPVAEKTGGFPVTYLGYAGAEALRHLASLEEDERRRQQLLAEAIKISERANVLQARIIPTYLWNIGVGYVSEGSLRYEFAKNVSDPVNRREMLTAAVERFRIGLLKVNTDIENKGKAYSQGQFVRVGGFYLQFVQALDTLFELTGDHGFVSEQLEALDQSAKAYATAQRPARIAEVLWQRARISSRAGHHKDAEIDYSRAAEAYQNAASDTPALNELYADLTQYMLAWKQIEEARAAHSNGLYREASEAYEYANSTLKSTKRWKPLADHYAACAILEEAEALSNEESPELAAQAFTQAAEGFVLCKQAIGGWLGRTFSEEEEKEKARWATLTASRERYCRARADLEEAKLLDRRGERALSARRFAAAAAILDGLTEEEETKEGKLEMRTLSLLCRAWQLMKEAEVVSKPEKYTEAARLFEQAAETTPNEKVAAMARGNAAFCHALESGTRLRLTRETTLYRQTKQYLETAADYYTEGGMERAARWTRATERMFDGLVYLAQAESELDAQTKSRSYGLAERSFEAAAQLYAEAGYSAKQSEANRHLQHAKEERRVFASPAEALDDDIVLSGGRAQLAPALRRDQPLGLERFETANVQANLLANRQEITIGEPLELVLELISAGRAPAILVKIADLAPSDIDTEAIGETYHVEGDAIMLKGLRLDPFKTVELRLRLKARRSGEFTIRPRILYLDEQGQSRQHQPTPFNLIVREMGIGGWLRGPGKGS